MTIRIPDGASAPAQAMAPFPGLETSALSGDEFAQLRQAAKDAGVTLNDLLMCHFLGAILDWNGADGKTKPRGWLRINVPTDLRRPEDQRMPAANVMSFTFLDRRVQDCQDPRALLASIRIETEDIKQGRLGLYFIAQLAILAGLPGGMRFVVGRQSCFATAVLSNLGDIGRLFPASFPRQGGKLVVGNLVLESLTGTPPLRPLTRVGVGLITYAGQLTLCVLCDRKSFSTEQSRRFLEIYLARIRRGLT
jgi:hypothetical protein